MARIIENKFTLKAGDPIGNKVTIFDAMVNNGYEGG
jgi:hypothetical protein